MAKFNMLKRILNSNLLLFTIIVLISSSFRITNMNFIEFKDDEAINLFLATRPLFGHPFPSGSSVSSVGILNPPLFNYLLFPLILISVYPPMVSLFIGLINSIAIGILFLIFKKNHGVYISLITSVLLAVSPWGIIFSRKIWAQDFIILFFLPILYFFHKIKIEKKEIYWLPLFFFSTLLIQIHQALIIFIVLSLIFLFFSGNKPSLKWSLTGILLGLIPAINYIIFQFTNNCPDCETFLRLKERLAPEFSFKLFLKPFQIINTGGFYFILGEDTLTFIKEFPLIYKAQFLFFIEYLLLPFGVFIFWKKNKNFRFLALSTILLPFVYFLLRIEPFTHYFIIIMPLLFLFLSYSLFYLLSLKNKFIKMAVFILIFLLIAESIAFNYGFFSILIKEKGLKGDYGASFTKAFNQNAINKYKGLKNEKELILASYLPKNWLYGIYPLAKILYPKNYTKDELVKLEENLRKNPEDELVKNELLAYYTRDIPDKKVISSLKIKSKENLGYQDIYQKSYSLYLSKNLRGNFWYSGSGLAFEYPSHWKVKTEKDDITLSNEDFIITLKKDLEVNKINEECNNIKESFIDLKFIKKELKKFDYLDQNNKWCYGELESFEVNNIFYKLIYSHHLKNNPSPEDKNLKYTMEALKMIIDSMEKE